MTAASVTPADLTITPRDRRFVDKVRPGRWWNGGDPIATALYNALSATFPKGEAFFVESVRQFRDGTPPRLAQEIKVADKVVSIGKEARLCENGRGNFCIMKP